MFSSSSTRKALFLTAAIAIFAIPGAIASMEGKADLAVLHSTTLKEKPASVPEPGTLVMIGGGLFTLFGIQRMRNRSPR